MSERRENFCASCKIYTDTFPSVEGEMTGSEVVDYLMSDCRHAHDDGGNLIEGDAILWYLASNEKFGSITYKEKQWEWGFGQASYDRLQNVVDEMYFDKFITDDQHGLLSEKIREGRSIGGDMYKIDDYLERKRKEI